MRFVGLNIRGEAKGLQILLREFAAHRRSFPGAELHLYGTDGESADGVQFRGEYDVGDLAGILRDFDAGVIPSVWEEPYGYVGPEMLLSGLPVIGARRGAIPEYVVHERTGLLFDPDTPGSLADALARISSDADLRQSLIHGASNTKMGIASFDEHVSALEREYARVVAHASRMGR